MYFWNTRALVSDLKRGPLPEIEQLKYFLFASILAAVDASFPSDHTDSSDLSASANALAAVSLVAAGTVWCFRTNAAGDNKDFIARFLALHVPIGFRLLALLFTALLAILGIFGPVFIADLGEQSSATADIALEAFIALLFYWRVNLRIRDISHQSSGAS